ncbi:MAG: MATE family efflux transporter, partial [Parasporobacterium sp.]|nr:MATE family efflux transporter [Parasporobacterium sp.]
MAGTKNLTEGSPIRLILGFAVPLLFGMLFQQFYGMVDTIIVGKHLGVKELAGVGATASVNFMVIGFCCGVCNGFSLPIAKYFGAGDYRGMRRFLTNAILLSAFFSVLVTACVCYYCRDILRLMNTPEDILDSSYTYIIIIFAGIPATILYNLAASVIRSLGDSKTPVL